MKNQHRFAGVILAAAVCNCITSFALTAKATVWSVSYDKQEQWNTNWCWVACARASGGHENPGTVPPEQQTLVRFVKSEILNEPGTLSETAYAARYASSETATYNYGAYQYPSEFFIGQLVYNNVAIAGWTYYIWKYNTSTGEYFWDPDSGHMVTISGFELDSDGNKFIIYYDPGYDNTYITSFDSFCSSYFTNQDGNLIRQEFTGVCYPKEG